jgi:hypothetical protein
LFYDFSGVHYENAVAVHYGAEAVRYHDNRPVFEDIVQGLYYFLLVNGIQRIGGLIEKQVIGVYWFPFATKPPESTNTLDMLIEPVCLWR